MRQVTTARGEMQAWRQWKFTDGGQGNFEKCCPLSPYLNESVLGSLKNPPYRIAGVRNADTCRRRVRRW